LNQQITRLFLVFTVLFGVLVGFTAWWSVVKADELEQKTANKRPLLEQQRVPRGLIFARDGSKLAVNERTGSRENLRYYRSYPQDNVFSHAIGYSFVSSGDAGIEKSENDVLSGHADEQLSSFIEQLGGGPREGDDVHTTLDPGAQREALAGLAGKQGAIVAIEPSTGAVRAMVSQPDFDPNSVPRELAQLNKGQGGSLFNRATQAQWPPGSTMKVVTTAAALDSGKYNPDSVIDGRDGVVISGVPLHNFGNQDYGGVTLTDALTNSVNTVFGQIGEELGKDTMLRYLRRFGFQGQAPIDYPQSQVAPEGVISQNGKPLTAKDTWDEGRVAIGQEPHLFVSPLQMAMVAAAVGNEGRLMQPRLVEKIVKPDGRVRDERRPNEQSQVMSSDAAGELAEMMTNVVSSGTGTGAQLQGIDVAGKTGTADHPEGGNYAWFIAFAPSKEPKVAIAVVVEKTQQSQTGGEVAAPIAARVMRELLGGG
jgi:peptidoglycan glycosyltransferase